MNDCDKLVRDQLVPFRERLIDVFEKKHPHLISILQAFLAGRENKAGLQVTEGGRVAGEYTFRLSGVRIAATESGKLESQIHHPFLGIIRPYAVVEREALAGIIGDEAAFSADFAAAVAKHLPSLTIKFLQ